MYCEHCGTQIPEGSIFCVACGKKQSGGVVTEEPRQDVIPPQEPEPVVTQEPEPAAPQPEQEVNSNSGNDCDSGEKPVSHLYTHSRGKHITCFLWLLPPL